MAGASVPHNQIVVNVVTALRTQLRGGPCRAYTSDLKIWIPARNRGRRPDRRVCDQVVDASSGLALRSVQARLSLEGFYDDVKLGGARAGRERWSTGP